jgi:RimJ/RimL family protein N-acetyltransferase
VLRLVPLTAEHLPLFERLVADPDVRRFTLIPDPPPPGYAQTWLDRYLDTDERLGFAAYAGERFVGIGLIPAIDREAAEAELGYMTDPDARGEGWGTELLKALARYAFDELGLLRLTLQIDIENPASQKVAVRAGFVLEGVMRSAYFKQGRRTDTQLWSRLPSDPEPPSSR